jgi:hypothetical protein
MRLVTMFLAVLAVLALAACPAAKLPTGPAPEYEEPPAPSWLDGGAAPSPIAPLAPDAG